MATMLVLPSILDGQVVSINTGDIVCVVPSLEKGVVIGAAIELRSSDAMTKTAASVDDVLAALDDCGISVRDFSKLKRLSTVSVKPKDNDALVGDLIAAIERSIASKDAACGESATKSADADKAPDEVTAREILANAQRVKTALDLLQAHGIECKVEVCAPNDEAMQLLKKALDDQGIDGVTVITGSWEITESSDSDSALSDEPQQQTVQAAE